MSSNVQLSYLPSVTKCKTFFKPYDDENLRVYTRRQLQDEQQQQQSPIASDTHVQGEQQAPTSVEIVELSDGETCATPTPSNADDSMNLPCLEERNPSWSWKTSREVWF